MIYKSVIRPFLFRSDAEKVHQRVNALLDHPALQTFFRMMASGSATAPKKVMGMTFPNPLGLAAGFDKNAEHLEGLFALGFGFVEIGTVTPRPQDGNPRPRLFRLPGEGAIINRMGFNNKGVAYVLEQLQNRRGAGIVGGNIGKNKITDNAHAVEDYLYCFRALYDYVDYFTVNVSSPNTPDLRALQEKEALHKILNSLQEFNQGTKKAKPVLLKIAPDMDWAAVDEILEVSQNNGIDGIIATNTTISRDGLTDRQKEQQGGLSGRPLFRRSTDFVRYIKKHSDFVVVGAGGIFSPDDALEKLKAGADLIQLYTGLIYQGPLLVRNIIRAIKKSNER